MNPHGLKCHGRVRCQSFAGEFGWPSVDIRAFLDGIDPTAIEVCENTSDEKSKMFVQGLLAYGLPKSL